MGHGAPPPCIWEHTLWSHNLRAIWARRRRHRGCLQRCAAAQRSFVIHISAHARERQFRIRAPSVLTTTGPLGLDDNLRRHQLATSLRRHQLRRHQLATPLRLANSSAFLSSSPSDPPLQGPVRQDSILCDSSFGPSPEQDWCQRAVNAVRASPDGTELGSSGNGCIVQIQNGSVVWRARNFRRGWPLDTTSPLLSCMMRRHLRKNGTRKIREI